jgi:hypothetical protein
MKATLREIIRIEQGFQTSVNIAYDLEEKAKIRSFIPTQSSLDIIEDALLSTAPTSTNRAKILIGAYGRGKSHIILVLLALLRMKHTTGLFDKLLAKMRQHNKALGDFADEYLKDDTRKLLPVIVRGSNASLTQAFLGAIQVALSDNELEDLMPETHFQAAVSTIQNWREDFPDTYNRLKKKISQTINAFILALKEYDIAAYQEFQSVYPELTSGGTFNPFLGFDVPELYSTIAGALKSKGYDGLFIVYDEFSKYLESSIANAPISDTKMLQDFAEKCNRSGGTQMHLLLICHKDIANYIDGNLPKEKVDGWRGVSGRFQHINLHNNYSQMSEIIATVIKKDAIKWKPFFKEHKNLFEELRDRAQRLKLIETNDAVELENAVVGCYPLHPLATFILPRLSEKIAQNERTLFTFLAANEPHTLGTFLETACNDLPLLTPDMVYDYFMPLLRKEPYTSEVHKLWKLTESALRRIDENSLGAKIIKTLSLIYLVEQFEKLPPTVDIVVEAYRHSVANVKIIDDAIIALKDKECIVYLKRSNGYLKIKETSGVDIAGAVTAFIDKTRATLDAVNILNRSSFDSFIYPTRYNDEKDITRYFEFTFITGEEFLLVSDWHNKLARQAYADGAVYAVVPSSQVELKLIKEHIANIKEERIVFVVPRRFSAMLEKEVFEYEAVSQLKLTADDDLILREEFDIWFDDLSEVVGLFVASYLRPDLGKSDYWHQGSLLVMHRKSQLAEKLSEICENIYYKTPIINNEMINKNVISGMALNSRTKVLMGLLANELSPNLGLIGTGQDVSIMRSTLIQTGMVTSLSDAPVINLTPVDEKLKCVLDVIREFLLKSGEKGASLSKLYDRLTSPNYHIGMKRGLIPIYFAAVLHLYKKNAVVISTGREIKITPELLNDINDTPESFSIALEDWNEEKATYIERLESVFREFIIEREKAHNNFAFIVLAMMRWQMSLPKYSKELNTIDKDKVRFIASLKQVDINPREYLFDKLPAIFNYKSFDLAIVDNIKSAKTYFDRSIRDLIARLVEEVKTLFVTSGTKLKKRDSVSALASDIRDWMEGLTDATKQHLFAGNEGRILEQMKAVTNDDSAFIQRLAKTVTGLRVEDWNEPQIKIFLDEIQAFKILVENFNAGCKRGGASNANVYRISVIEADGTETVKTFERAKYGAKAKLLFNDVTTALDDYGQALTDQEKRQVIMEILEQLC